MRKLATMQTEYSDDIAAVKATAEQDSSDAYERLKAAHGHAARLQQELHDMTVAHDDMREELEARGVVREGLQRAPQDTAHLIEAALVDVRAEHDADERKWRAQLDEEATRTKEVLVMNGQLRDDIVALHDERRGQRADMERLHVELQRLQGAETRFAAARDELDELRGKHGTRVDAAEVAFLRQRVAELEATAGVRPKLQRRGTGVDDASSAAACFDAYKQFAREALTDASRAVHGADAADTVEILADTVMVTGAASIAPHMRDVLLADQQALLGLLQAVHHAYHERAAAVARDTEVLRRRLSFAAGKVGVTSLLSEQIGASNFTADALQAEITDLHDRVGRMTTEMTAAKRANASCVFQQPQRGGVGGGR